MAAVQFWGKDSVLKAFEHRDAPSWSIWQGRQFLFKFEGTNTSDAREALAEVLEMISEQSTAIYTLKIYEDLGTEKKIKSTTPDDGSFNFKLIAEEIAANRSVGYVQNNALVSELNALKLKVAEMQSEEIEPEGEPDVWERIGELLEKPVVVGAINKLFGVDLSPVPPSRALGNVPPNNEQIEKAIAILKTKDSRLGEHLSKLASMAVDSPANFNFLLTTLDSMK